MITHKQLLFSSRRAILKESKHVSLTGLRSFLLSHTHHERSKQDAIKSKMLSKTRIQELFDHPSAIIRETIVWNYYRKYEDIFYKLSFDKHTWVRNAVISRCRKKHRCILERLVHDSDIYVRERALRRSKQIGLKIKC